ncbi:MAG TPA: hypothetical protein VHK27_10940 [Gammaproteobacteria bacterium]|nr:hypothetical protein [Gammaproteobacteria bacterium]
MQADAAKDAARTQRDAAGYAADVQRDMFDISRAQQLPFMQSGYGANAELSRLMGIAPQTALGNPAGTEERTQWDEDNGQLVGDTYLPPGTSTVDVGNGWYEVHHGGQRIGTLRPGGPNGRFINDTGWTMPTPAQIAGTGTNASGEPTQGAGGGALPTEGGTGLPTGYLTQLFGPEQFLAGMDPGYQWRMQQGAQGVMNTAAAGSGSLSGPALKALMEYNQGAASQEYGNAFNRFQTQQGNIFQRLTSMAGMGQNAAAGVGNQAVATGGNIGANIVGGANAAAAGQVGAANAWGGALSDLGSAGMWAYMNRNNPGTGTPPVK